MYLRQKQAEPVEETQFLTIQSMLTPQDIDGEDEQADEVDEGKCCVIGPGRHQMYSPYVNFLNNGAYRYMPLKVT